MNFYKLNIPRGQHLGKNNITSTPLSPVLTSTAALARCKVTQSWAQVQLGSGVAVAVVSASSYSSD